jgi:hypothetical protein
MSLITIKNSPSPRELNWFAALGVVFLGLIGGLIWWRTGNATAAATIWAAAGIALGLFVAIPSLRRPMYLAWMYAAFPIGWTVSHVVLAFVFYVVFTPLGVVMRLAGRDPLQCGERLAAGTYWIKRCPAREPASYFRQF